MNQVRQKAKRETPEPLYGRVPPHNIEAEMATLGSVLLGGRESADAAREIVSRDDFYREINGEIFDAMLSLADRGEPVDIVTLKNELTQRNELDRVGGIVYLMHLGEIEFTTANLTHYARIVQEKSILRRLIDSANQIAGMAYREEGKATDLVAEAERRVFAAAGRAGSTAWATGRDLTHASHERIAQRYESGTGMAGISTGFTAIDRITAGCAEGDLIIVAARPAMGKTAWAASLTLNVAKKGNIAAFVSLEMKKEALQDRFVAAEAKVNLNHIRNGKLSEDEWHKVDEAHQRLFEMPYAIEDSSDTSISLLEGKLRRLRSQMGGLDLVVVDYLQYLSGHLDKRYPNRNEEVTDIAKGLKSIAKRLSVPVVALCQLSRAVEQRQDKRPLLSDLRESGAIESEGDIVAFLYRDSYYAKKEPVADDAETGSVSVPAHVPADEVEFIIAKQRNGDTGFVRMALRAPYCRFDDWIDDSPF